MEIYSFQEFAVSLALVFFGSVEIIFPERNRICEGDPLSSPEGEAVQGDKAPLTTHQNKNFSNCASRAQICSTGRAPTRRRATVVPSQTKFRMSLTVFYRACFF